MTTIAARAGVLASDSRETDELDNKSSFVASDRCKKIFRLRDGRLFGAAGSAEQNYVLWQALDKKLPIPKLDSVSAIVINRDGSMELYEGQMFRKINDDYYAIGSGAGFAISAMDAGASAERAAQIGAQRDPCSGGRVQVLKLRRSKR